jgi:hypothetical protein
MEEVFLLTTLVGEDGGGLEKPESRPDMKKGE